MTSPFDFADATGFNEPAGSQYEIDSKAMRKVDVDDDLAIVWEMRNVGGGIINMEGRMLIQLH